MGVYYDERSHTWINEQGEEIPEEEVPKEDWDAFINDQGTDESEPEPEPEVKPEPEPQNDEDSFFGPEEPSPEDDEAMQEYEHTFSTPGTRILNHQTGTLYEINEQGVPIPILPAVIEREREQEETIQKIRNTPDPFPEEDETDPCYLAKRNCKHRAGHSSYWKTKLWSRITLERDHNRLRPMLSKLLGQRIETYQVPGVLTVLQRGIR